jgi:hypothetical protein
LNEVRARVFVQQRCAGAGLHSILAAGRSRCPTS